MTDLQMCPHAPDVAAVTCEQCWQDAFDADTKPDTSGHQLTHVQTSSGRWVPACSCGWWSHDGSHATFERHVRRETFA